MSSSKIYPFNTLQLRLVNQLIVRGNAGRKTDALAVQVGVPPSDVSFELLKLRELGYVSTVNDGSAYVTWYSSPGLVDALNRYTASKVQCGESVNTTSKRVAYKVFGPEGSRYMPRTYANEADAMREAAARAKNEPGRSIEIYTLYKTLVQKPEQVIPGELIVE
ncbi:hypothetical protein [Sphingobium sp. CFD-1]|uniref:hypothetical protein n=1 Tax=Sphingobium sp. CFD-1 TaxID=2878545 RepID=UPI00214C97EA|nr:hypothetical protein [Sphingobium sp. CFD-1]